MPLLLSPPNNTALTEPVVKAIDETVDSLRNLNPESWGDALTNEGITPSFLARELMESLLSMPPAKKANIILKLTESLGGSKVERSNTNNKLEIVLEGGNVNLQFLTPDRV